MMTMHYASPKAIRGLLRSAPRIGVGTAGPMLVAFAHFGCSIVAWGFLAPAGFGLFSFILLLVQLSFGISNALVGTPLSVPPACDARPIEEHRSACLAAGAIYALCAGIIIGAVALTGGSWGAVALYALFACLANIRWASRSDALARECGTVAASSDTVYAALLAASVGALVFAGRINLGTTLGALCAANAAAILVCNRPFIHAQMDALRSKHLRAYRPIWRDQARWSVSGVLTTEASSNAHAYSVILFIGAAAFAPIAFASMFWRPLSVFLGALTQLERPSIARSIREGDRSGVRRTMQVGIAAVVTCWVLNIAVAFAAWRLSGPYLAERGYEPGIVATGILFWGAIMGARALRAPLSTLAQAEARFRTLAVLSAISALASILGVLALIPVGAVYALAGVLFGDIILGALLYFRMKRHHD